MVIKQLLQYGVKILSDNNIQTPQLDAALLLCYVLGKNRSYLIINHTEEVEKVHEDKYKALIKKRANNMPVAYIIGSKEFMSLDLKVNENVLIPRADTETLCEFVIEKYQNKEVKIADICCGSGCIGVSLAIYIKDSHILMADISDDALSIAEDNAKNQGVSNRCLVEKVDILNEIPKGMYDIIVSNPPYIESDVIDTLEKNVSKYEPRIALDGGKDGLDFYRRITKIAPNLLACDGMLVFEVGHTQADAVENILAENGFANIGRVCDLAGIERVVYGIKKIK